MRLRYPPLLQFVVSGAISYGIAYLLPSLQYEFQFAAIIASLFGVLGIILLVSAVGLFAKAKTTVNPIQPEKANTLVSEGLYNYTRNPMYLGLLFCLIGIVIWLRNPLSAAGIVLFIFTLTVFQIKPEEKVMSAKFGKEYEDYKARVRRWL